MPRRAKKADDVRKVKNPGFIRSTGSNDESSDEEPPTAGQHMPEVHLHRDEADILEGDLEQGELMDETDSVGGDTQPNDMLALVRNMKREQKELKQQITELTSAQGTDKHEWKKEGLKKQDDIAQKVIGKLDQGLKNLAAHQYLQVRDLVTSAWEVLKQRAKELRVADASEAGWETVNVYRSHPVAEDSDDDRKIRKAEKLAKERLAVKTKKSRGNRRGGFGKRPYNRPWQPREDYGNQYRDQSYRAAGSGRSLDQGQRITQTADALPAIQYASTVDRPATGRTNVHRKTGTVTVR